MKKVLKRTPYFRLWCAFFAFTAIIALFVQLVALPYLFPQWHVGNGLLIGGDWLTYHRLAVKLAEQIRSQGWGTWTLRPEGGAPAGIAGAIYALTVPKPWTLIPLNAALHATAALVLLMILQFFIPNWRLAIWAVLPFFLYPSTLLWTTQILKDGYSIAGFLLFLYGWLSLTQLEIWRRVRWRLALAFVWVVLGAFLIWIVRPYMLQMMQILGAGIALVLAFVFLYRAVKKALSWPKTVLGSVLIWAVVVFLSLATHFSGGGIYQEVPIAAGAAAEAVAAAAEAVKSAWQSSKRLPDVLEDKFYTVANVRERSRLGYPDAASNIDTNIAFTKASDVIAYSLRATQIAFLTPYPNQWFEQGSNDATTLMRRVSAAEMIGVYAALILLPFSLWRWRRKPETWVLTLFCAGMMVAYGLVIANVGSLYRVRYGFLMTLVALGIAGGLSAYQRWSYRSRAKHNSVRDP